MPTRQYQVKRQIQITSYSVESSEGMLQVRVHTPLPSIKKFPVILFLSGFPGYQRNFDLALGLSLSGSATCTFDYPGTWGSQGKFYPLVGVKIAKEVKEFLLDILSPHVTSLGIFGHSWGATIALLCAAQDPSYDSIATLALVNDLLAITGGTRESIAQMFLNDATPLGIEINQDKLEADLDIIASRDILKDAVHEINQPVFLMHGSKDQEVPPSQSQRVNEIAQGRFVIKIIPDEKHNPKNRETLLANLLEWYKNTLKF